MRRRSLTPQRFMRRTVLLYFLLGSMTVFVGTGCPSRDQGEKPRVFKSKKGQDHDHEHSRADAMLEDLTLPEGTRCHAGLTAHLDAEGNELDVFFESAEREPKPIAIPKTAQVTARVTRSGDDQAYQLTFQPAPAGERPNDPADRCSRYSAPTPWLKPDDKLTVVVSVEYDGQLRRVTFADFVPSKHAHRHEANPDSKTKKEDKRNP